MVTGIATAMLDSSPVVCITGQVPTGVIGSDAFQEVDITGITLPITKHNYLVTEVEELVDTIREAFHIARTGRPGPVLIDIPKDVQIANTDFEYPEEPISVPSERPVSRGDEAGVEAALELINSAKRPFILAGHGVTLSGAEKELQEFAEMGHIPVGLTLLGKGAIPEGHPLCFGMMGMHGDACVNHAIQEADLLLAFGMRFDDRVTGDLKTYALKSKKIHVDIDASEINKNVRSDVGIVGNLKDVLSQFIPMMKSVNRGSWISQIRDWQKGATPLSCRPPGSARSASESRPAGSRLSRRGASASAAPDDPNPGSSILDAIRRFGAMSEEQQNSPQEPKGVVDLASVLYVVCGIPAMILFFVVLFGLVGICDGGGTQFPA